MCQNSIKHFRIKSEDVMILAEQRKLSHDDDRDSTICMQKIKVFSSQFIKRAKSIKHWQMNSERSHFCVSKIRFAHKTC